MADLEKSDPDFKVRAEVQETCTCVEGRIGLCGACMRELRHFPDYGGLVGYVVLTLGEFGRWRDDWDGEVHTTFEDGQAAIRACSNAGWTCILTELRRVEVNPDV